MNATEHFSIAGDRLTQIADESGVPAAAVRNYLLTPDWAEGDEHQNWLDTAPIGEIVDWLCSLIMGIDEVDAEIAKENANE